MGHGCVRLRAGLCCCSGLAGRRQAVALLAGCGVGMGGAVCRCGVPGSRWRSLWLPLLSLAGWRQLPPTQDWEWLSAMGWGITDAEGVTVAGNSYSFWDR